MWRLIPHCNVDVLFCIPVYLEDKNKMIFFLKLAITKHPSFRVMSSSPATDANADDRNDNGNKIKNDDNYGPRRNGVKNSWG